ncbi:hypothetical protein [Streptosporangium sp. NPDC048865]
MQWWDASSIKRKDDRKRIPPSEDAVSRYQDSPIGGDAQTELMISGLM